MGAFLLLPQSEFHGSDGSSIASNDCKRMRRKEKKARRRLHYPLFPGSWREEERDGAQGSGLSGSSYRSLGRFLERDEREGGEGGQMLGFNGVSRDSRISCFASDALRTKRWSGSSDPAETPIRKRFVVVRTCFVKRTLRLPICGRHLPTRVPSSDFMEPHDKVRTLTLILRHVGRTGTP
ncbi:hypothetical protein BHE74_00019124 [Ensete ventricosum]|nr:hypothetical protein BHE74_00019124 [Ensete ventricosum]